MVKMLVLGLALKSKAIGRFITIEGGEGVGKSTFAKALGQELRTLGVDFVQTHEPGGTPVAELLRNLFVNPPSNDPLLIETEFCIVSAARAQHVGRFIKPHLAAGRWVLCDRFADSSRVYQGFLGGLAEQHVEEIIGFTTFGLEPDLTFLLDCPTDVSLARLDQRQKRPGGEELSRYDRGKQDMHERIKNYFLQLEKKFSHRIIIVDTSRPFDQIIAAAKDALKQKLL